MTPDALRQTLIAEHERVCALCGALHDHIGLILAAGGEPTQPTVQRLGRIADEVDRAAIALTRAIGELELMVRAQRRADGDAQERGAR